MQTFVAKEKSIEVLEAVFLKIKRRLKTMYYLYISIVIVLLVSFIVVVNPPKKPWGYVGGFSFIIIVPYLSLLAKNQQQTIGIKALGKKLIKQITFVNGSRHISIVTTNEQLHDFKTINPQELAITKNPYIVLELSFELPYSYFSKRINCFFMRIKINNNTFYLLPAIFDEEEKLLDILERIELDHWLGTL